MDLKLLRRRGRRLRRIIKCRAARPRMVRRGKVCGGFRARRVKEPVHFCIRPSLPTQVPRYKASIELARAPMHPRESRASRLRHRGVKADAGWYVEVEGWERTSLFVPLLSRQVSRVSRAEVRVRTLLA